MMTAEHDRFADDAAAYALGALNELEAAAFERHLMRCTTCARELETSRSVVDALPLAVPQYRASDDLKRAVMDRVRDEAAAAPAASSRAHRRLSFPRLVPRRAAAVLAGGLAAAGIAIGGYAIGGSGPESQRAVIAAAVDRTQLPDANAELARRGDIGVLRTSGLPPAPEGQVYVVWVDRGQGPVYASSFNVEPKGRGQAGVGELDGVERVMVTREPSTAVAHPSESPVVTVELS